MVSLFDALDFAAAHRRLATLRLGDGDEEARDFYRGDHWRGGDAWVGQKPPLGEAYVRAMEDIRRSFISENTVKEVVDRHRDGVLGREPRWGFVPRRAIDADTPPAAGEVALMAEADAALTEWWDRHRPLRAVQEAAVSLLTVGRGPLRLCVPRGRGGRDDDGRLRGVPSLAAALDLIFLDAPDPASCGVVEDDDTRQAFGLYGYRRDERDYVEVAYVADDGATVLRQFGAAGMVDEASPSLPLDGRLPFYELRHAPLITPQVRQAQQAINLDLTQMVRNVNLAGSLERTFLNAQPPGKYVNADGSEWQAGQPTEGRRFVAQPYQVGAGISGFLRGLEVRDRDNNLTGYANASVSYRDPVPVETFVRTRDQFYASILGQCGQLHALISGDAAASGESRKQARAEFEASLDTTKTIIDDALRWLLETVLALAAHLAGQGGRYAALRCEAGAIVDAGPLTADERREIVAEYTAGVISRETTQSRLGVDDTDAEQARIEAERAASSPADGVELLARAFNSGTAG